MLRSTLIIPTYNREDELTNALRSVLIQTRLPDEVIVVDDGNLPKLPFQEAFQQAGVKTLLHKKSKPGLTESRNAGIRLAAGDVILFLDDDVVLFPNYVEEILKVFESDQIMEIGGVGGIEANLIKPMSPTARIRRALDIVFLMGGFREGRVLPSGYCTEYGSTGRPIRKLTDVDFLVGATSAYRSEVCRRYSFTAGYNETSHAIGEDKDFSYRVSRKHRLVINPDALLFHFESPKSRASLWQQGRSAVIHRYAFFHRHVDRGWHTKVLFYYALFGHVLSRYLNALAHPGSGKLTQVKGMISAIRDISADGNTLTDG